MSLQCFVISDRLLGVDLPGQTGILLIQDRSRQPTRGILTHVLFHHNHPTGILVIHRFAIIGSQSDLGGFVNGLVASFQKGDEGWVG